MMIVVESCRSRPARLSQIRLSRDAMSPNGSQHSTFHLAADQVVKDFLWPLLYHFCYSLADESAIFHDQRVCIQSYIATAMYVTSRPGHNLLRTHTRAQPSYSAFLDIRQESTKSNQNRARFGPYICNKIGDGESCIA